MTDDEKKEKAEQERVFTKAFDMDPGTRHAAPRPTAPSAPAVTPIEVEAQAEVKDMLTTPDSLAEAVREELLKGTPGIQEEVLALRATVARLQEETDHYQQERHRWMAERDGAINMAAAAKREHTTLLIHLQEQWARHEKSKAGLVEVRHRLRVILENRAGDDGDPVLCKCDECSSCCAKAALSALDGMGV